MNIATGTRPWIIYPLAALIALSLGTALWLRGLINKYDAPPPPELSLSASLQSLSLASNVMSVSWRVRNRSPVAISYGSLFSYADLYIRQPSTNASPDRRFWILGSYKTDGSLSVKSDRHTIPPYGAKTLEFKYNKVRVAAIDEKTWLERQVREAEASGWFAIDGLRGLSGELLAELHLSLDNDISLVASDYREPVLISETGELRL